MPSPSTPILTDTSEDGVVVITLNSPATRNAVTVELAAQLEDAVAAAENAEGTKAIIVAGAGPAFCAGGDRATLQRADSEVLSRIYRSFLRVRECTLPTIAAVTGPAVGAGCNLALACDLRVAGESAVFDTRFVRLGVHGGGGASWMLTRAVGPSSAAAMLLFGEPVDGPRAERIGLAWACVADEQVLDKCRELARTVASADRDLVKLTKNTLRAAEVEASHTRMVGVELARQVWSFTPPTNRGPWSDLVDGPELEEA